MIDIERADFLATTYLHVKNYPGWFPGLIKSFALTEAEQLFLEELDETFAPVDRALREWDAETRRERELGIFGVESAEEKIVILSRQIAQAYVDYEAAAEKDAPLIDRMLMLQLRQVERMEHVRRSLRAREVHHRPRGFDRTDQLTDQEIVTAREFPLERLVVIEGRVPYIKCPFHDDNRPSALVKGGYLFCFSCGAWCDSIKWMMTQENMTFPDAVRSLNQR